MLRAILSLPRTVRSVARSTRRFGLAFIVAVSLTQFALSISAHDPLPSTKKPAAVKRVPTRVEPVPAPISSFERDQATTNFEFIVKKKHGIWLQEIYEIGAISDEQNEIRFAVVRAYEPGKPNAHVTEATALRIDVRTYQKSIERAAHGWLDSHEVAQLSVAIPGVSDTQAPPLAPGNKVTREIQLTYPRGGVALGLNNAVESAAGPRLFVRAGRDNQVTASLKPERVKELEKLVNAANQVIKDVQDKAGHHR
jgi:hypothetical protein